MRIRIAVIMASGLAVLLAPGQTRAEEEGHGGDVEYRHRAEVFLGVAHEEGTDEFAAGLAYEYRLNRVLGLGGFAEHAGEKEETWTFGVPLFVHPYKGVRFLLAPGWETKEVMAEEDAAMHEPAEPGAVKEEKENEQSFLVRAGVAYELELGRWSITPEFNADLVEGGHQVLVYGVSLGCGF